MLLQIGFHPIVFATSRPATKIRSKSLRWSNEEKKNNTVVTQYPYMSMVNRGMAGCGVSTNRNTKIVLSKTPLSLIPLEFGRSDKQFFWSLIHISGLFLETEILQLHNFQAISRKRFKETKFEQQSRFIYVTL